MLDHRVFQQSVNRNDVRPDRLDTVWRYLGYVLAEVANAFQVKLVDRFTRLAGAVGVIHHLLLQ